MLRKFFCEAGRRFAAGLHLRLGGKKFSWGVGQKEIFCALAVRFYFFYLKNYFSISIFENLTVTIINSKINSVC